MTMVVSHKQRIFFRYEGERGAFLVLHHGLLGSHDDWYAAGYVEQLAKEFRVVVPDARGHGRSDKPAEKEQYSQLQMAEDIVEILNELGIRNSHFVGYGLGALVGVELLRRFPERMRIVIVGGESALVTRAVQDVYRAEAESLKAMSLGDYLKALRDHGRVVRTVESVDEELERPAALALLEAISEWEPAPAERIQVMSPLTLFAGSEDPAAPRVEAARSGVSRARHVSFSGMGHARLFHERTSLMEEILRLLKSGRREEGSEARAREAGGPSSGEGSRLPAQGGDRRTGGPSRREGPRPGNRWNDRAGSDYAVGSSRERPEAGGTPRQATAGSDVPSPIPGAILNLSAPPPTSEGPLGEERDFPEAREAEAAEAAMGERAAAYSERSEEQAEPAERSEEQAAGAADASRKGSAESEALSGTTKGSATEAPHDEIVSGEQKPPDAQGESPHGAGNGAESGDAAKTHTIDEPPKE